MKIETTINRLFQHYWEIGYVVKEICMPKEFKDELASFLPKRKGVDMYEGDYSVVKLFVNQSKHLNIIIEPVKIELEPKLKRR